MYPNQIMLVLYFIKSYSSTMTAVWRVSSPIYMWLCQDRSTALASAKWRRTARRKPKRSCIQIPEKQRLERSSFRGACLLSCVVSCSCDDKSGRVGVICTMIHPYVKHDVKVLPRCLYVQSISFRSFGSASDLEKLHFGNCEACEAPTNRTESIGFLLGHRRIMYNNLCTCTIQVCPYNHMHKQLVSWMDWSSLRLMAIWYH